MFSVIIPHYNNKSLLENCLTSIKKADITNLVDQIIVVDNGSTDGSIRYLRGLKSKTLNLKPIFNPANLGFAQAVNQGIKSSKTSWVIILNNDIKLKPGWFLAIKKGIKKYQDKNLAFLFGKVLNQSGTKIESVGLNFHLCGKSANIGNGEKNSPDKYKHEKELVAAPASAICFKKSAIVKVGLFDQDFFVYLEDLDLCLRLADCGFRGFYLPSAVSFHLGGATSNKMGQLRWKMTASNWWFIIIKYYPILTILTNIHLIIFEQTKNFLAIYSFSHKLWTIKRILKLSRKMIKKRQPIRNLSQISQISKA